MLQRGFESYSAHHTTALFTLHAILLRIADAELGAQANCGKWIPEFVRNAGSNSGICQFRVERAASDTGHNQAYRKSQTHIQSGFTLIHEFGLNWSSLGNPCTSLALLTTRYG